MNSTFLQDRPTTKPEELIRDGLWNRLRYPLAIALLGMVFFADLVLHPTQVLYSDYSDLVSLHIPARHFQVRSWQETGELPLWCPYRYGGMPFIHDIQLATFYPPHWPLFLMPVDWLGPALSWLIVVHVILAGWCMYAYARSQGLSQTGSLVAAMGYMFAGKWLLQMLAGGHYVAIGLAWVPLILLLLEQAIHRGSFLRASAAGVAFALVVLGAQPQWTFYSGLFIALWTLAPALEEAGWLEAGGRRSWIGTLRALAKWMACGAWTVVVAASLAAIQLLPTAEASTQSVRAVGHVGANDLELAKLAFRNLFGPSWITYPPGMMWEERGGLVILWAAVAAMAPFLGRGRVRYQAAVGLFLILFAPIEATLLKDLPGFNLFRQPTRMFLVAGLPVAFLAGWTTDALFRGPGLSPAARSRCRQVLVMTTIIAALLAMSLIWTVKKEEGDIRLHGYWLTLLATVPLAFWLLGGGPRSRRLAELAWVAVLVVDLWALVWPLVEVRPLASLYPSSPCVDYLVKHPPRLQRVLDREETGGTNTPLGTGAPLAMLWHLETVRGYTPIDVFRFKEYLQFIGDADEPLLPFQHSLTYPVVGALPVENQSLVDLLGVEYILQPAKEPIELPGWEMVAEDPLPRAFDLGLGGVRDLPPYRIYRNPTVLPRAFIVPEAKSLPDRPQVLAALKTTDFRRRVLLEGNFPVPEANAGSVGAFRPVAIPRYEPNHVTVTTGEGPAGYLVLTDVWFPGWSCKVDGRPVPIYRADFLFRAVALPAGSHEVAFTFEPSSYRLGARISIATLALLAGLGVFRMVLPRRRPVKAAGVQELVSLPH